MAVRDFLKDVPKHHYNANARKDRHTCFTVKDVIKQLKNMPEDLPVSTGMGDGVLLTIYNAMEEHDHVSDDEITLHFDEVD